MSVKRKVAVITGASAGVGLAAARTLVSQGWQVIGVGRDAARCAAAQAMLREAAPGADITLLRGDLAVMADTVRLAGEIAALTDRVDLLANNAGGMVRAFELTGEGLEVCFAGNHLGPFLLTQRLLPLLRAAAADAPAGSVRIINTSSDGSEMIPGLNWADLQNLENWSEGAAYCSGKLANVLFARGLAARLAAEGIMAFSFHPGTVDSNFIAHVPESSAQYMATLQMITPDQGADTLLWLAAADTGGDADGDAESLENGGYYYQRALRPANPEADDPAKVVKLWEQSERLVEGALTRPA